jgi:hypothetical protein
MSLPFKRDPNTAMGILMYTYLVECKSGKSADEALKSCETQFGSFCSQIKSDLKRAFVFWDALLVAVKAVANDATAMAVVKEMQAAAEADLMSLATAVLVKIA